MTQSDEKNSVAPTTPLVEAQGWSRPLPSEPFGTAQGSPSSVTVIKDRAGRYFLSFVVEIQPAIGGVS